MAPQELEAGIEVDRARVALAAELERALAPGLRRERPPLGYALRIVAASGVFVLLPLLYVALVVAVSAGVGWWAWNGADRLGDVSPRAFLIGYMGPIVSGVVVVLALAKPLVARRVRGLEPTAITASDCPTFFAVLTRTCAAVGARLPSRVTLDMRVNASAGLAVPALDVFRGRLILNLGLPLVAGLSVRQFLSVLAHELGHCRQGLGLRAYYLTAVVHRWFRRAVYERDRFDAVLADLRHSKFWMVQVVLNVAAGCVWCSRKLLLLLLRVGEAINASMSRQMEFDADRNAVRLAGTEAFRAGMQEIALLDAARQWAEQLQHKALATRRFAADHHALVVACRRELPEETVAQILEVAGKGAAGMYASHPPNAQRIARAEALDDAGLLPALATLDQPASFLFEEFEARARDVGAAMLAASIGERAKQTRLVSGADLFAELHADRDRAAAALAFFGTSALGPTTLALDTAPAFPDEDLDSLRRILEDARERSASELAGARDLFERRSAAYARQIRADALVLLQRGDMEVLHGDPRLEGIDPGAPAEAFQAALAEGKARQDELQPFLDTLRERLGLLRAIALRTDRTGDRSGRFDACYRDVVAQAPELDRDLSLAIAFAGLRASLELVGEQPRTEAFVAALLERVEHLRALLLEVRPRIEGIRLEDETRQASWEKLRIVLLRLPSGGGDHQIVLDTAGFLLEALGTLRIELMNELGFLAHELESELGLPPVEARA